MVNKTRIPFDSSVAPLERKADFYDGFEVDIDDDKNSALYWYLDFAGRTPKWIEFLMSIRNRLVGFLGLKDLGKLSNVPPVSMAESLRAGDRVGIFTIRSVCDKEVVLEIIDTHLNVVLCVYREDGISPKVKVITMVFNHNILGWLYMLPVAPIHKVVVRSMLSRHDQVTT